MSKADLSKRPDEVAAMFDEVAQGYDRTNAILSAGNEKLWREITTRAVRPLPGEMVLDVAAGTGTSSAALARHGAHVIAADISAGMLETGRKRQAGNPFIEFVEADARDLPFDNDVFDAVTISFGLRNVDGPAVALAEFYRVLKPGGRLVVCEFSRPPLALVREAYFWYLEHGMPLVAKITSSNAPAYGYLMDSIRDWPQQRVLARWLRQAGFERVAYRNVTGGIVALHRGYKPIGFLGSGADARSEAFFAEAISSDGADGPDRASLDNVSVVNIEASESSSRAADSAESLIGADESLVGAEQGA